MKSKKRFLLIAYVFFPPSSATCADIPSTKLPSTIDSSRAVEAFKTWLEALTTLLRHNLSLLVTSGQQKAMRENFTTKDRIIVLLNAVLDKITHKPPVFIDFVKILETEASLKVQANELVIRYQGECMYWGLLLVAK